MFEPTTGAHKARGGRRFRLVLCLLCVAASWPLAAQDGVEEAVALPVIATPPAIIARIEFTGNRVTQPRILLQEMLVKEGDLADPVKIERSRQSIMDLGLFKSVQASLEPLGDGVLLRIAVEEKYYILPTPKLNRDDDNHFTLGAEIKLDNVAGLNQRLRFRYEVDEANSQSGGQIDTYLLSYEYPRVSGSAWSLSTEVSKVNSPAEVKVGSIFDPSSALSDDSLYKLGAWTAAVQASRWLNPHGLSRGWQAGGGLVWRRNVYEYLEGVPAPKFQDVQAVGVSLHVQYVDVHDFLFSRSGEEYGYNGEYGSRTLGSDTRYTRHDFFYRKFLLLDGRPHENIEIQGRLGLSSGEIFAGSGAAYSLGGSRSLRGVDTGTYSGDAFVLFNAQYLRPFFGYYPLRGVLFLDVGNVYPSNSKIRLDEIEWDVGIGLRFRLKSFVKIDLRVDAAYSFDTGNWNYKIGTKEIF